MKKLYPAAALAILLLGSFSIIKTPGMVRVIRKATDTIDLPASYKTRHFLADVAVATANPASMPGNIARYSAAMSGYDVATLKALVKGNKPAVQNITNSLVWQGQITPESSLNGSSLILELKAETGQVIDMEITDNVTYSVPDGQIDTAAVKSALKSVSAEERKDLFYIISATATTLNYKIHAVETIVDKANKKAAKVNKKMDGLAHNDTAKNGVYAKVTPPKSNSKMPGSYSSGNTKMLTDKAISFQLIPVDELIK